MKNALKLVGMLLIIGTIAVTSTTNVNADNINFHGGAGTAADPYQISTSDELSNLSSLVNGNVRDASNGNALYASLHYKLISDIDLGSVQWVPIGKSMEGVNFKGTFDGNGKTISNLTIGQPETPIQGSWYLGLFGYVRDATIRNIGLENVGIYSFASNNGQGVRSDYITTGCLIGESFRSTIENCYAQGVISTGANGDYPNYAGGLIGEDMYSTIANCYATLEASIDSRTTRSSAVGGLMGYIGIDSNVQNCYGILQMHGDTTYVRAGGFAADRTKNYNSYVSKCYYNSDLESNGLAYGNASPIYGKTSEELREASFISILNSNTLSLIEGGKEELVSWKFVANKNNGYPMINGIGNTKTFEALPIAKNIIINGLDHVDQELTATYDYYDIDGDIESGTSIQWYRTNDYSLSTGQAIEGATNTKYRLTDTDTDQYVFFTITPANSNEIGLVEKSNYSNKILPSSMWNGEIATSFSTGSGISNDPYQISSASELGYFASLINTSATNASYKNAYYVLTDNIILGNNKWQPIGINSSLSFNGHFDGAGHTIDKLTIGTDTNPNIAYSYMGLFGYTNGAEIINVGIENVTIYSEISNGNNIAGGLIGFAAGGKTLNCYVTGNVSTGTPVGKYNAVGGLIGYGVNNTIIANNYSTANVNGKGDTTYGGGLVGLIQSGAEVVNSYATGVVSSENLGDSIGGLVGKIWDANSKISYGYYNNLVNNVGVGGGTDNTTGKTTEEIKDSSFVEEMNENVNTLAKQSRIIGFRLWKSTAELHLGYPMQNGVGCIMDNNEEPTATNLIIAGLVHSEETLTATYDYYDLDGDNEQGTTYKWYRAMDTSGSSIEEIIGATNTSYTVTDEDIGYFLCFEVTATNTNDIGKPVKSGYTIEILTADAWDGTIADQFAGGSGTEIDPYQISTSKELAYLAELVRNSTTDPANSGALYSTLSYKLTDNIEMGYDLSAQWKPIGESSSKPFQGHLNGNGKIVTRLKVGHSGWYNPYYFYSGLFGYTSNATIENLGIEQGGIYTHIANPGTGDPNHCRPGSVGMLVGYANTTTIKNCYTTGTVSVIGGGYWFASNNYNYAGGLVGCIRNSTLINCYSTADVLDRAVRNYVGGLVGSSHTNSMIINCSAHGDVRGEAHGYKESKVGGLVGTNSSAIKNSYATGAVTGRGGVDKCGGLVGSSSANTITNGYWNKSVIDRGAYSSADVIIGKYLEDMNTEDFEFELNKNANDLMTDDMPLMRWGRVFNKDNYYPMLIGFNNDVLIGLEAYGAYASDNGSIVVTAIGGNGSYEYMLDHGEWQLSNQFTGLAVGNYQIKARDVEDIINESIYRTATVGAIAQVSISAIVNDVTIIGGNNGEIEVQATGGKGTYEYRLDNGDWQESNQFTNLSAASYQVMARDKSTIINESLSQEIILTQPEQLVINVSKSYATSLAAIDGSISISAIGGNGTYEYRLDGEAWQASNQFTGLAVGNYQIMGRDRADTGNESEITYVSISSIVIITTEKTDVTAYGTSEGSITINSTGGNGTYEYKHDGGVWQEDNQFNGLIAKSYEVTSRDKQDINNESVTQTVIITQPEQVAITVEKTNVTSYGASEGSITINSTGGNGNYEYRLDNSLWQESNKFNGLYAKSYEVASRDKDDINNISEIQSIEISQPDRVILTVEKTDVTKLNGTNGAIEVTGENGNGTYEYKLDDGIWQESNQFLGLSANRYEVMVRDKVEIKNESEPFAITLTQPSIVTATIEKTDTTKLEEIDGTIRVSGHGGNGTYEYKLDDGTWQESNQFIGLSAKTYKVMARDKADINNESESQTVIVSQPDLVTIIIEKTDVSKRNGTDGAIKVIALGGGGSYEYSLDNSSWQESDKYTGLSAKNYEIKARDKNDILNESEVTTLYVLQPRVRKRTKDIENEFETEDSNINGLQKAIAVVKNINEKGEYAQSIPENYFKEKKMQLNIKTPVAAVTLPENMFDEPPKGKIELSIKKLLVQDLPQNISEKDKEKIGDMPIIDVNLWIDGKKETWSDNSSEVELAIPYTPKGDETPSKIVGVYIRDDGKLEYLSFSNYNKETGTVVIKTKHFSYYTIQYINKEFEDMENYSWAEEAVNALAVRGIVNGISENKFGAEQNITRGDFVLLISKLFELNGKSGEKFSDISGNDYYYEAICKAREIGIVTGTGENTFKPQENITRQDMMVIIKRALDLTGKASSMVSNSGKTINDFTDMKDISDYAIESSDYLVIHGLIEGNENRLQPKEELKRTEAAVLLYRILVAITT